MKSIRRHVRKANNAELCDDGLTSDDVGFVCLSNVGIPNCANSVAYDSIQRTLAVGTTDGRVKLVGGTGVESALESPKGTATTSLTFVKNKGCLLRLDEVGTVELWSMDTCTLMDTVEAPHSDTFTCLAVADVESFVILGCSSGALCTAQLVDSTGQAATEGRSVQRLSLLPTTLAASDMGAEEDEPVESLKIRYVDRTFRLIVRHAGNSVTIWDYKAKSRVAQHTKEDIMLIPQLRQAWAITSTCWASRDADAFMTGHESGVICHWKLDAADKIQFCGVYEVCDNRGRDPVHDLEYIFGEEPSLLVLGGNMRDLPSSLSRIILPRPDLPEEAEVRSLPWFGLLQGYALVKPYGSFSCDDDPTAIIAITEGGRLCIHDLKTEDQKPFALEFQALPVYVSLMASMPTWRTPNHALCMPELRAHAHTRAGPAVDWSWVLSSGVAADNSRDTSDSDASVLVTGHSDGSAMLWDTASEVPAHLFTLKGGSTRQVTALAADWGAGLLAVGHDHGQVDVYQWSLADRSVDIACVGDIAREKCKGQPAGWQRVLVVAEKGRDDAATCLCWHSGASGKVLLAVGHSNGNVSIVDVAPQRGAPKLLWSSDFGMGSIGTVTFCLVPGDSMSLGHSSALRLALVVVTSSSSMRAIDALTGEPCGSAWMNPKNADELCQAVVLTSSGTPVAFDSHVAQLRWAGDLVDSSPTLAQSPKAPPSPRVGSSRSDLSASTPRSKRTPQGQSHFAQVLDDSGDEDADDDAEILAAAAAGEKAARKGRNPAKMIKGYFNKNRGKSMKEGRDSPSENSYSEASSSRNHAASSCSEPTSPSIGNVDDGNPAVVGCIVVVTKHYIRLYPRAALFGDRSSVHKLRQEHEQRFAAPFMHPNGPGLFVLSQEMGLTIYTLPGLKPLAEASLDSVTGWVWDWECDALAHKHFSGRCSLCCTNGKLAIIGPCQELVMLSLDPTAINRPLNKCSKLFDKDMAAAAHCAETAFRSSQPQRKEKGATQKEQLEKVQKGFINLFKQAEKGFKTTTTGIVDISKLAGSEIAKMMDLQPPEPRKAPVSRAESNSFNGGDSLSEFGSETGQRGAASGQLASTNSGSHGDNARVGRKYGGDATDHGSLRKEARGSTRTASDIRSAYGRDRREPSSGVGDTAAIMSDNIARLKERQERLERLEERGADLEKNAANFAEMAKQLNQQANKPWWKLG